MKLLNSINCEPYGYIKYNPDDVDNIIMHEVKDIKQTTEYIEIKEVENYKVLKLTKLKHYKLYLISYQINQVLFWNT